MATVSLSTSPTTLDDGTAYMVQVTNTGTDIVALSRSGIRLKAGQGTTIYPEGIALTATAPGGTGSVTTTATAKTPGQADTFLSKADATATYLTQVAANSTYAGLGIVATGKRKVGFIGDSITAGDDTFTSNMTGSNEYNNSPALYAMFGSARGSWDLVISAGIGGQNSTQILARLQSDIIANGCDICVIYSCTWNDIGGSFTVAQSVANVTAMIQQCLAAKVLPVLCTPTPDSITGGSAARKNGMAQRRRQFVELARVYGIPCVDLLPVLVDPSTGAMASAYTSASNDVHPNAVGRQAGGLAVAAVLDRICAGSASCDVGYAGDADDMLGGFGYFNTDTNADGLADGWGGGTGTGITLSVATDGVIGKVQRVTTSSSVGNSQISRGGLTVTPGHVYEISGYMSKTGTSQAQISINPTSGNRRITITGTAPDITRGRFSVRWIPSAGNSSVTFYMLAGAGTGVVDFGRITMRDLTALGLA